MARLKVVYETAPEFSGPCFGPSEPVENCALRRIIAERFKIPQEFITVMESLPMPATLLLDVKIESDNHELPIVAALEWVPYYLASHRCNILKKTLEYRRYEKT